jgi:hypothetical protein
MPIEDLRNKPAIRDGITVDTVVYEDILDSITEEYFDEKTGEIKRRLVEEVPLTELSKCLDRFEMFAMSRWAGEGIKQIEALLLIQKKRTTLLEMLKKRLTAARRKVNLEWEEDAPQRFADLPEWKRLKILERKAQGSGASASEASPQ